MFFAEQLLLHTIVEVMMCISEFIDSRKLGKIYACSCIHTEHMHSELAAVSEDIFCLTGIQLQHVEHSNS